MIGSVERGLAAGAAGTTALTAATYLDMAWRGRPPSRTPERVVDAIASAVGRSVPGSRTQQDARRTGLGALAGIGNGLLTGVLASTVRSAGIRFSPTVGAVVAGGAAMAATDVPAAVLGVTDPRTWSSGDWLSDAVPHLAYGVAAQAVLEAVPTDRERAEPRRPARAGLVVRSLLLGVATGSRSSLGLGAPALFARRRPGRPGWRSALSRLGALAVVSTEVAVDKRPETPERTSAAGLPPRFVGAVAGASRLAAEERMNAAVPALGAAAGAALGSWGGLGWRRWAAGRMPDVQAGFIEDGVALLLAGAACLPGRRSR
ncbi:hypothetical protein DQ238_10675 [Geodermatophilus sp. TF02-6]|uniref:hypothetical protein n=1 Tax=Geodermatophilus sp. TF02-6 TaxID=2250575 RepID=UPI000DE9214D|nr:hypothetical protein [Geodermatophilus sp. TF02-6]RBY78866.1 hypothetical protein DQ238_10675 [Geodermatophilus sp. TF02-6]